MNGATEQLANFVSAIHYEDIPNEAIITAKQAILDCLGCIVAGSTEPAVKITSDYAKAIHGAPEAGVIPYDIAYNRSLKEISELVAYAEKYQVYIGIEHVWSKFLLSPLEMRDFIDKLGSKYLGAYFDVGNVLLYGYPEQWIRILGSRIKAVHFKDFKTEIGTINGFCPLLYGDVNWIEVMRAFHDVKYNGFVTAELFPPKLYPDQMIFDTASAMKRIVKK